MYWRNLPTFPHGAAGHCWSRVGKSSIAPSFANPLSSPNALPELLAASASGAEGPRSQGMSPGFFLKLDSKQINRLYEGNQIPTFQGKWNNFNPFFKTTGVREAPTLEETLYQFESCFNKTNHLGAVEWSSVSTRTTYWYYRLKFSLLISPDKSKQLSKKRRLLEINLRSKRKEQNDFILVIRYKTPRRVDFLTTAQRVVECCC